MPGATDAGTAWIRFRGDFTNLNSQLAANLAPTKLGKLGKVGGAALAGGLAAAGVGKALYDIGKSFDEAYDSIRVQTGKTGRAFEGLKRDFKAVVKDVPTDFKSAADAIGQVNSRLDLAGKPLRRLSKQFLELSRITETDLEGNVASVTRAFGDWEVKTKQQGKTLDFMFRASQRSGASVSELAELIVKFGAPLRRFGFDVQQATSMFALFEKAGVNIQTMVPGLKLALSEFLESGRDPEKALLQTFAGIEKGTIKASDAINIFGKRAGSDMVEAIEQGRFKFDEFRKSIASGDDTIMKAAKNTRDFSEHWQIFKNRVMVGLEPIATRVFNAVGRAMERVGAILTDPNLTAGEKFSKLFEGLIGAAGEVAPKAAGAFMRGFVNAPVLGQLITAAVIWKMLGGPGLFSNVGGQGAGSFVGGFRRNLAIGLGSGIVIASLSEIARNWGKTMGDITAERTAQRFGPAIDELAMSKPITGNIDSLRQMSSQLRSTFRELVLTDHAVSEADAELLRMAKSADRAAQALEFKRMRQQSNSLRAQLTSDFKAVRQAGISNTKQMAARMGVHWKELAAMIRGKADDIKLIIYQSLAALGVDPKAIRAEIGRRSSFKGDESGIGGLQRGGAAASLVRGSGTGDKVPALLEPGEVVVNRKAVQALGGAARVDAINHLIPRFATGGPVTGRVIGGAGGARATARASIETMVEAGNQAFKRLKKLAGGDLASIGNIVALGRLLQKKGYQVGENPKFGGVQGRHAPNSYHYSGRAIDVNHDQANEPFYLDKIYKPLKQNKNVVELLWRVADHFDHLHVAMARGGVVRRLQRGGIIGDFARAVAGRRAPRDAALALYMAGWHESGMRDLSYGDSTSQGVLQLLASTAQSMGISPHNEYAIADAFLSRGYWGKGSAIALARKGLDPAVIAHMVQGNATGTGVYAAEGGRARRSMRQAGLRFRSNGAFLSLGGQGPGAKPKRKGKLKGKIKQGVLPPKLQGLIDKLEADADTFGEYASRASDLNGLVFGADEIAWLQRELQALFDLRNALVRAREMLAKAAQQITETLAKGGLKKKAKKKLRENLGLVNTKMGEIAEALTEVHGATTHTGLLSSLPPVGELGGRIFEVQSALIQAGEDASATGTESKGLTAEQLKEIMYLSGLGVKFNPGQFAGIFHGGGVIPGPPGSEQIARVQGGEGVFTTEQMAAMGPGATEVRVFIGERELTDIVRVEIGESDRAKAQAYRAGVR